MNRERGLDKPAAVSGFRRAILWTLIAILLGTGAVFRVLRLESVPGVSGDEGWWGVQANAWLAGTPYQAHTTSGNPTDQFLLVPLGLLHAVADPSFATLRLIPASVNLLALPVAFWFVRRLYGSTAAWIHVVAIAVLPTAIAHSRICQDPSQTIFWTGIVVYLSLLALNSRPGAWKYAAAALLVFPVALWTHPTNVFIAPFVAVSCAMVIRPLLPASRNRRAMLLIAAAVLVVIGFAVSGRVVRYIAGASEYLDEPWFSIAFARMVSPGQWFEFAANNARLLNGVTIYHYFSGARPFTVPHDVISVLVIVAALWGFLQVPAAKRVPRDAGLLVACVGTWFAFFALAGPHALRPHAERWGLCLIVPATLVLARGLAAWLEWRPKLRSITTVAILCVAAGLLTSFYVNYFRMFATTGGRSHLTYVTAPVEPKRQALAHILATSPGSAPVAVFTQQWWIRWPMAYLATNQPNVSVTWSLPPDDSPGLGDALTNQRLFLVEFVGTSELSSAAEWVGARGLRAVRTTIRDASGRDLLEIFHVSRP